MESAFIIGVFGTWAIIALIKGIDWLSDGSSGSKESDYDFFMRVAKENRERDRKLLEEIKKSKRW
jgi:hypothetical protein